MAIIPASLFCMSMQKADSERVRSASAKRKTVLRAGASMSFVKKKAYIYAFSRSMA